MEHTEGRAARIILDVLGGVFYTLQHLLDLVIDAYVEPAPVWPHDVE
ncbi:MAG: hypothetical protein ACXVH3_33150 [Solirubrobacteraceae bacterium]